MTSKGIDQKASQIQKFSRIPSERSSQQQVYDLSPSKIVKKQTKQQQIKSTKYKLDDVIQQLNGKLLEHFQKKQQNLLQEYKRQLINAQKQLNQLKANTNEQQIRNKMIQRKRQLERERHELIQANMFFSNKCQVYKKKLSSLVQQGKQLEREVIFLQGQLETANKKRLNLISEIQDSSRVSISEKHSKKNEREIPIHSAQKVSSEKQQMQTPNGRTQNLRENEKYEQSTKAKGSSLKKITKSMSIQNPNMLKNKRTLNFGNSELPAINGAKQPLNYVNSKIFQKTPIEQLFEEAVDKIREKKKAKKAMPSIKGQEFTDYEKRLIMQEFLGNQKVKKKIYQIIFEQANSSTRMHVDQKKVRISLDDVNF